MRGATKQFARDIVAYGLSDSLLKIVAILTVPILTRLLSPADAPTSAKGAAAS